MQQLTDIQALFLELQGRDKLSRAKRVAKAEPASALGLDFAMLDVVPEQRAAGMVDPGRKRWMGPIRAVCCEIISSRNERERERAIADEIHRLNTFAARFPVGSAVFWDGAL